MFDGVPPGRRRRITDREMRTLRRMEDAAWQAECDARRAEQRALRVYRKMQRYAEDLDRRLGPGGMGNKPSDLITEWLVNELNGHSPQPGEYPIT